MVGTAQTKEDFYFDERAKQDFKLFLMPGVSNIRADKQGYIVDGTPLWKEWIDLEGHKRKQRSQGIKVYSQEYLCNPVYSSDSFFQPWQIEALVGSKQLITYDPNIEEEVVGGWDLGKHSHPAHFTVMVFRDGKARQIHDKWFDGVDYTKQLEYIEQSMDDLNIDTVYFDNTRGELEALKERGDLPAGLEPINFTTKSKSAMATEFERFVTEERLQIIDNKRTINQICIVTNDLKARETSGGHGDSFWSFALCFAGFMESTPDIYIGG